MEMDKEQIQDREVSQSSWGEISSELSDLSRSKNMHAPFGLFGPKRKVGRPRKHSSSSEGILQTPQLEEVPSELVAKRKRGRPRKVSSSNELSSSNLDNSRRPLDTGPEFSNPRVTEELKEHELPGISVKANSISNHFVSPGG